MASLPTSEEKFLNASLIDGKERIRISKQDTIGQKLWKNWQISGAGFMKWLFAQLNIPPSSLQLQSDWTETNTNSVRYIRNKPASAGAKVYRALLYQQGQSGGLLTIGVEYRITVYNAPDDFTNVGAVSNVVGEVFVATGTTPASWTNFSTLTNNLPPIAIIQENSVGNIVWGYAAQSVYAGVLTNAFPQFKTYHNISKTENISIISQWGDINTIYVLTSIPTIAVAAPNEPLTYVGTDGYLFYTPIEIIVYP